MEQRRSRRTHRTKTAGALAATALALALTACGGPTGAEPSNGGGIAYPERPVEVVVGFNAGGALDLVARQLAKDFPADFGQSLVVLNQPGDGGVIGAQTVFNSAPDGQTAYLGSVAAMAVQPWRSDSNVPYGGPEDYTPVATILAFPQVMAVPADAPYDTPAEFAEYAEDHPKEVRVGTGGIGTLPDVALSQLKSELDLDLVSVPFQGFAQSVPAILGGSIEAIIASPADVKPHVESGALKIIGSFNESEVPGFPEVESFTTAGMAYTQDNYYFLLLPAGVDDAIVEKLSSAVEDAVADPDFVEWAESNSAVIQYEDSATLTERLQEDYTRYEDIIRDIGL